MTNRKYMQTLNDEKFEAVMHAIYFECICCRMGCTPNMYQVRQWLSDSKDNHSEFWKQIDNM